VGRERTQTQNVVGSPHSAPVSRRTSAPRNDPEERKRQQAPTHRSQRMTSPIHTQPRSRTPRTGRPQAQGALRHQRLKAARPQAPGSAAHAFLTRKEATTRQWEARQWPQSHCVPTQQQDHTDAPPTISAPGWVNPDPHTSTSPCTDAMSVWHQPALTDATRTDAASSIGMDVGTSTSVL
jgi:hypothetical protein